ncbi:MAG: thiolase family protein [Aminivibrio sp.]|jgi:acetyl-CoA C-acetyltransferase
MTKKTGKDAVIVAAVRTPVGKIKGALASVPPAELGAAVLNALVEKTGIKPEAIDDIFFANLFCGDWGNLARVSLLQAGLPQELPGITMDRQCASSLSALALAASTIRDGMNDVIIAGGVESYSQRPYFVKKPEQAYPDDLKVLNYKSTPPVVGHPTMIQTAENLARKYGISREACDEFALSSHQKAAHAWESGWFDEQVIPFPVKVRKGDPIIVDRDESVRFDANLEAMAKLKPVMSEPGSVVTAGNSSPRNDGASAALVMSREKADELGLEPLALVKNYAAAGCDPYIMGIGPVYATRKLMDRFGYSLPDFDLIELNEAFAAQSIACLEELKPDLDRVNMEGGAIAIGHPNAASGGILVARAVYALRRRGLKRALITFCIGGGQGFSLVIENENC